MASCAVGLGLQASGAELVGCLFVAGIANLNSPLQKGSNNTVSMACHCKELCTRDERQRVILVRSKTSRATFALHRTITALSSPSDDTWVWLARGEQPADPAALVPHGQGAAQGAHGALLPASPSCVRSRTTTTSNLNLPVATPVCRLCPPLRANPHNLPVHPTPSSAPLPVPASTHGSPHPHPTQAHGSPGPRTNCGRRRRATACLRCAGGAQDCTGRGATAGRETQRPRRPRRLIMWVELAFTCVFLPCR